MEKLIKLIAEFNPILLINGVIYNKLSDYTDKADYSNNCLHCFYHNKEKNTINISFISEYELSKITGSCGC